MFSDELFVGRGQHGQGYLDASWLGCSSADQDGAEHHPAVGPASFWQSVTAFERAPHTTHFQQLVERGMVLEDPSLLDDADIMTKLWEVIDSLASMRVYLKHTDHLSDRQLYEVLWWDLLREETVDTAHLPDMHCHLDILGHRDMGHKYQYLKFFADEQERRFWAEQYPDLELPQHQDPPFHRDASLPS